MKDEICGYYLDEEQERIVLDESKYLLVVAGAGSGKTLTILGKINYLLKYKNIKSNEILCISFTRDSSKSLENKIKEEFNIKIPVYTFHKLSLEILNKLNMEYIITSNDTLSNIIHEFIYIDVLNNKKFIKLILSIFNTRYYNKNNYLKYINSHVKEVLKLEKLIETFIHLFKCNNYKLSDFNIFLNKSKKNLFHYKRDKLLLIIILNIYLKYNTYLKENNEIDFDDMIIYSILGINKDIDLNYKYIIIDEYQDTSYIRFMLIKKILDITDGSLLAVGDDFQSIYRFTGCDLSLFLDFNKYFKDSKILKIQNTYRNSNELISVAGSFVMKNKNQIKKELRSNKRVNYPIEIIYYKDIKKSFKNLINLIYKESLKPILVLGRNNFDINNVIDKSFKLDKDNLIYLDNLDIKIRYLTIHKSKGLEEENVIIINMNNGMFSLPSKLKEDRILSYVSIKKDKYLYGEERRLFYVGLTRTKNKVYLFCKKKNESIFIKELIRDYKDKIIIKDV